MSKSTLITTAGVGGQPNGVPLLDGNSGLLVPGYAEVTQTAAPAAPAAGKTRLYVDASGLLQLLPATGGGRRIAAHWGSGAAFPTSPALAAGDTFLRTDLGTNGSLWQYTGLTTGTSTWNGWVCEQAIVCTSTTRPTNYAYQGLSIFETDTRKTLSWSGSYWLPVQPLTGTLFNTTAGFAPAAGGSLNVTFTFPASIVPGLRVAGFIEISYTTPGVNTDTLQLTGVGCTGCVLTASGGWLGFDNTTLRTGQYASDYHTDVWRAYFEVDVTAVNPSISPSWQRGTGGGITLNYPRVHYTAGLPA